MNWDINKVNFKLKNFDTTSENIIGSFIRVKTPNSKFIYKISNYLGKGSVGQVYLLENETGEKYVIKISKSSCNDDLKNEITFMEKAFKVNKINHKAYPLYYGSFQNLNSNGAIFPFLGYYSLDKIKSICYKIGLNHNKNIIKQLLNQLKSFKNIIHADLKPANVVIDIKRNEITATIIDFGLTKILDEAQDIISTSYITSPESLLSFKYFNDCIEPCEIIDFSKHDYIGLFCIIIHLFTKKGFWSILSKYLTSIVGVPEDSVSKHETVVYFVYTWFKFFYTDVNSIELKSLQNLIKKIEELNPEIVKSKELFLNWDNFFNQIIIPNFDDKIITQENIELLKNFTKNIVHFNFSMRPSIDALLSDPFLIIKI